MINQDKLADLAASTQKRTPSRVRLAEMLNELQPEDLDTLWEMLQELRPRQSLADLNLEHELLEQYNTVKTLQEEVLTDDEVPANQRAQVANTVASTLQQLVKMQTDYYNAERFKAIEALVLKAIKSLPKEVAEKFIEDYERIEQ